MELAPIVGRNLKTGSENKRKKSEECVLQDQIFTENLLVKYRSVQLFAKRPEEPGEIVLLF